MQTILVTGGAGYIGSHTVRLLASQGRKIVVLDNLVFGHEKAIVDPGVEAQYRFEYGLEMLVWAQVLECRRHHLDSCLAWVSSKSSGAKSFITRFMWKTRCWSFDQEP